MVRTSSRKFFRNTLLVLCLASVTFRPSLMLSQQTQQQLEKEREERERQQQEREERQRQQEERERQQQEREERQRQQEERQRQQQEREERQQQQEQRQRQIEEQQNLQRRQESERPRQAQPQRAASQEQQSTNAVKTPQVQQSGPGQVNAHDGRQSHGVQDTPVRTDAGAAVMKPAVTRQNPAPALPASSQSMLKLVTSGNPGVTSAQSQYSYAQQQLVQSQEFQAMVSAQVAQSQMISNMRDQVAQFIMANTSDPAVANVMAQLIGQDDPIQDALNQQLQGLSDTSATIARNRLAAAQSQLVAQQGALSAASGTSNQAVPDANGSASELQTNNGPRGSANDPSGQDQAAADTSSASRPPRPAATTCTSLNQFVKVAVKGPRGPGNCPGETVLWLTNNSDTTMDCAYAFHTNGMINGNTAGITTIPSGQTQGGEGGGMWACETDSTQVEYACFSHKENEDSSFTCTSKVTW